MLGQSVSTHSVRGPSRDVIMLPLIVAAALCGRQHPTDPTDKATWDFYVNMTTHIMAMPPNNLRNFKITRA